jgi:protein-disulfide isomerase
MEDMSQPEIKKEDTASSLGVPIAIIIAGALIAGAVYLSGSQAGGPPTGGDVNPIVQNIEVPQVRPDDHIVGNPDADIVIVEYSDLECPYCKVFHETMKSIIEKYGRDGKVAWVYRNFPLPQIRGHENSPKIAEAAECVAELSGNDVYWKYLDALFVAAPVNKYQDMTKLDDIAASVGVDKAAFQTCYDSGRMKVKVDQGIAEAMKAAETLNGVGTPFNIMLVKGEAPVPIVGAQPFENMSAAIEKALSVKASDPQVQ